MNIRIIVPSEKGANVINKLAKKLARIAVDAGSANSYQHQLACSQWALRSGRCTYYGVYRNRFSGKDEQLVACGDILPLGEGVARLCVQILPA